MNEAQRLWDECAGILRAQVSEPVWLTSFEAARAVDARGRRPDARRARRSWPRSASRAATCPSCGTRSPRSAPPTSSWRSRSRPTRAASRTWTGRRPPDRGAARAPTARRPRLHDINPRYTFDAFVIGAVQPLRPRRRARRSPRRPARSYNPLFIYGDAGLGKTHLLQAIGHYVARELPATTGSATSRPRRS